MNVKLTEHQQPVFNSIWDFVEKGDPDGSYMALLAGSAGSGKSTMTIELVKKVLAEAIFNNIAVCSPTHKSLRVIKEMLPITERSKIKFSTVHALLGLKHKITNNGKEVFERDKNSTSKFGLYDVVIVDESSMLSDDLFHEMEKQNYRGVKIIFVGDPNQINPVNHEHSIPMLEEPRAKYRIKKFELTEVVRQAKGNPIIETSQKILRNEFEFRMGDKLMNGGKGWAMLNRHQPEVINEVLRHYFCSPEFDANANHCKLVAWRNVTVDNFNQLIRGMKYGLNAPKIVVGEKLIVDKPIKGDTKDEILFNTNEDLVVLDLAVRSKEVLGQQFKYYDAKVAGDENLANIHILHESSNRQYEMCLKKLADDAKNEKDSFKRGKLWGRYFEFQDIFSAVNYNMALTVHSAQGSTYTNTFVVYTDIMLNRNEEERQRILYTACTRPREMLYFL
jgi:exodeoxyribonuclease-5